MPTLVQALAGCCGAVCGPLQMPLCYHPSLEYQLNSVTVNATTHVDVVFPGVVTGKPRREAIVNSLKEAGMSVRVRWKGVPGDAGGGGCAGG